MSKYIAIDLDPSGMFVVGGSVRGGQAKVEHALAWSGTEAEGGPPALSAETARRIGEQLRDRLKAAGVAQAPVCFTVGRDRVVLKELRYPQVPPQEEPNVVRFQALKELTDAPDEIVLDYVPLANGAGAGERRSMAVAIRKDLYSAIQAVCAAANLKLAAVTPRPYAVAAGLARALASGAAAPPEPAEGASVAVLTPGPGGGEFTVARGGEVVFTLAVPAPVAASEPMLLAQVRRNLATYAGSNPAHPVRALYVAEAGPGWADRLRAAAGVPVHAYDPLAGAVPAVPEPTRGRFAAAAGMLAAQGAALPINFAQPRQPRADADPNKNRMLVAALAAAALLAVVLLGGRLLVSSASDDVAALTQEREDKKKRVADLEPDARRLDAVNQWRARRVDWLDELFDMTDRFPHGTGVYATSFSGKANPPDPKTGKQESQATVAVRMTAPTPDPVNTLLTALDRENPDAKTRYYVGVTKTTGGPVQWDKAAREYTVLARVNGRPPEGFVRAPSFSPPARANYPPPPPSAKDAKKTEEPADKDPEAAGDGGPAPAPREPKEKTGGE